MVQVELFRESALAKKPNQQPTCWTSLPELLLPFPMQKDKLHAILPKKQQALFFVCTPSEHSRVI